MDAGSVMTSWSAPSVRTRTRTLSSMRLDVDVGRPVAHGLLEDEVDDLDDRGVLVDLDHRDFGGLGVLPASFLGPRLEVAQRVVDVGVRAVAVLERPLDLVLGRDDEGDRSLERFDQARLECLHEWIRARDVHALAFDDERDRPQLVRDRGREPADDLGIELVPREVDGRQSELRGQRDRDVATGEELHVDEHLAEAATGADLRGERGVALLLGDEFLRDEDVAEGNAQRRAATGGDAVTPESLEERRARTDRAPRDATD